MVVRCSSQDHAEQKKQCPALGFVLRPSDDDWQGYRQDTRMAPIMPITIGMVSVSIPYNPDMATTTTRPHKENLKISAIKSIKSTTRKGHGCVVVITWRDSACMVIVHSRTSSQKKNEKASSCEQRLLERNPHLSLWYRFHHEATQYKHNNDLKKCDHCQSRPLADRSAEIMVTYCVVRNQTMPMWTWWSLDSFADKTNSDPPSCQSRLLCELLFFMRAAWCSSRNHAAQKQDEQLLSCTIRNTEHRPSCQVALRYRPPVKVNMIRVYRTTTQCKYSIDHDWDLFANNETGELPSCASKLLRARLAHIMVAWCSPQDHTMQQQDERLLSCTHKTTEQNATKYSEETSYKCEGQWCLSQDHTVQMSQWSSLAPLHNQDNTMSTKLVCKCPPEILVVWSVFVTELYVKM